MAGKFLFTLFLIFSLSCGVFYSAFASTAIFSDGFESDFSEWTGNDPKWETSGGNIHGGAKRVDVKGNTEPGNDVLLKVIPTEGYENITLNFWYRIYKGLEDEDHVYVEWTGNGSSWELINDFTTVGDSLIWELASYNLPAGANNRPNFAIRFRAHLGAATSDIFYLDDVILSGDGQGLGSTPNPTSTPAVSPTPSASSVPTVIPSPSAIPPPPSPTLARTPTPLPSTTRTPTLAPVINNTSSPSPQPMDSESSVVIKTPAPPKAKSFSSVSSADSTNDNSANETGLKEESRIPITISASMSKFFSGSRSLWLISIMVLAVVFSLAKLKKH